MPLWLRVLVYCLAVVGLADTILALVAKAPDLRIQFQDAWDAAGEGHNPFLPPLK